jgi:hypothetical protein
MPILGSRVGPVLEGRPAAPDEEAVVDWAAEATAPEDEEEAVVDWAAEAAAPEDEEEAVVDWAAEGAAPEDEEDEEEAVPVVTGRRGGSTSGS